MAKKSKKSKKLRKKQKSKLLNLTDAQRIEKARQFLSDNNAREAISILKTIPQNSPHIQDVNGLLFQSYMLREQQLLRKGMKVEADSILEQAFNYLPDFSVISEDVLLTYMTKTSLPAAADALLSFLHKKRASKQAEQLLADRIAMTGQWQLLDAFDDNHLLKKDQEIINTALPYMHKGQWEEALKALKPLSRQSPYSNFKLLCRGMVAFYAENDSEMIQSFNRIPAFFSMKPTIQELKVIASPMESFRKKGHAISKIDYLWDGAVHIDRQIGRLIPAVDKDNRSEVISIIQSVSKALYPKQPEWAQLYILLLLMSQRRIQHDDPYLIESIAEELLNKKQHQLFKTKKDYKYSKWPFLSAARYLDCLPTEFRDKKSQNIAKAMILLQTARRWFEDRMELNSRGLNYLTQELNLDYDSNEDLLSELVSKALKLDPHNRTGYEFLMQIPRKSRKTKNVIEKHLLIMLDLFKNDPAPCLELATLFYEKHAYRKAETILEEAMKRAPHDNRVIERHVISLLISAATNFKRHKMHLVERDMERASEIDCKSMLPYLIERSILYGTAFDNDVNLLELIHEKTASLSTVDIFKIKALLYIEKNQNSKLMKKLLADLKKEFLTLSGNEILSVLAPLPKAVMPLYEKLDIITWLFEQDMKNVFPLLDDFEILLLFDIILSPQTTRIILKEIRKRLKNAKPDRALMLEFYQVTIWHLENKEWNPDLFYNLLEQAKGTVRDELQALSRRLAKHAAGSLKRALESLEFHLIAMPFPHFLGEHMEKRDFDNDDYIDGYDDEPITIENLHDDDDDYDDDDYGANSMEDMMKSAFKKAVMNQFGDYLDDDFFDDFDDDFDDDDFDDDEMSDEAALAYELNRIEDKLVFIERTNKADPHLLDQIIGHFEKVIDYMKIRGEPKYIVLEARKFFMKDAALKSTFKRMAKVMNDNNYKDMSQEAKLLLFKKRR